MTLLPQALLALVGRHFVAFPLTSTGHGRLLSVNLSLVIVSCAELKAAAPVFPLHRQDREQLSS